MKLIANYWPTKSNNWRLNMDDLQEVRRYKGRGGQEKEEKRGKFLTMLVSELCYRPKSVFFNLFVAAEP